jgi:hypothetical protein
MQMEALGRALCFCSEQSAQLRLSICSPVVSLVLEFHLGCMIAMRMASAGRFSPLGPRGMSFPPDNGFGWFDDLYGVPSDVGERNDG